MAGSRAAAVIVKDSSGTVLSKVIVHGTGLGSAVEFSRGSTAVLFTPAPMQGVNSVAVDGGGSVYFVFAPDNVNSEVSSGEVVPNMAIVPAGNGAISAYARQKRI